MVCAILVFAPTFLNLQGTEKLSLGHEIVHPRSPHASVVSFEESERQLDLEKEKYLRCGTELELTKRDAHLSKREASILRSELATCEKEKEERISQLVSSRNDVSLLQSQVQLLQEGVLDFDQDNLTESHAAWHHAGSEQSQSSPSSAVCKGWYCPRIVRESEPQYGVLSWRSGFQSSSVQTGESVMFSVAMLILSCMHIG